MADQAKRVNGLHLPLKLGADDISNVGDSTRRSMAAITGGLARLACYS